jgi:uncharacterized protein YndB with AHSA1/START domain
MSAIETDSDGVIRRTGETYEIVFRRRLAQPIEKVWAALTVPERVADWLAEATIEPELRLGARWSLRWTGGYSMSGEIVAFDPPRLIAWTWPDDQAPASAPPGVVRFELKPDGDGCVLTLTNSGLAKPDPDQAAGWHTHLEGLAGAADGVRTPWSAEREAAHLERYKAAIQAL